ncbi:MAG TPA: cytochrome c oxidase assembly protein, partial [Phycicoccus sp.]|nr:cytochrome c oxidase assembly protein [Phycicoccus sp.]
MVIAVGAALARERTLMAWLVVLAIVGIIIQALTSHSGGSALHEDVVNSMGVHLLAMSVWVGGLAALALLRPRLGRDLGISVRRYSVLALWSYLALAISGAQQGLSRIGSWGALTSGYGLVVLAKLTLLVILGALGWQQRRVISERLSKDPADGGAFGRLALLELALMGLAAGLSAALARSAPPVPDSLPNPSIILSLTSYPDPGPIEGIDWITAWRINWLFLAIAILAVGFYLAGVRQLRRRGDSWPWWRTLCWILGWAIWVYFTSGAGEIWGRVLFSVHMIMHMGVAMIMPLFLVPGAPITLALRAIPARKDKTWGARELILRVVHSRAMRVLANPVVAAVLFFFSLAAFYWTNLFTLALTTHTGHLLMMAHFALTGFLFVWVLIGVDPGPPRWSPLMLLVILFVTISFHAFFGVALTDSQDLLAADFFTRINLPWGPDPLADQHKAGMIAWGVGEAPTLALAIIVAVQWIRRDRTETVRKDRQADRDGDAELTAYNDYLASLRGGEGQR